MLTINYIVTGKSHSPCGFENSSAQDFQNVSQLNYHDSTRGNSSPQEEFPGFSGPKDVVHSGTLLCITKKKWS